MSAFAIFRLPYEDNCHVVMQEGGRPEELASVFSLDGKKGFVIAPFSIDSRHPVLLIRDDKRICVRPEQLLGHGADDQLAHVLEQMGLALDLPHQQEKVMSGSYGHYAVDFANFHSHIENGEFTKIVLARCCREENHRHLSPVELFVKACRRYPRLFVSLFSTPRSGTWLMATPEALLQGDGKEWSTMSLAGTMVLQGSQLDFDNPPSSDGQHDDKEIKWNVKNIQEQRYVSTYITERLEQVASDIEEKGPYTTRAGHLVHLRSDFRFTLPDTSQLGELLNALYPTPAVCGLPKDAARDFIIHNEFAPRQYYSGFAGPFYPEGDTHLFVSLRCMRIEHDACSLFAGGGLLSDSDMDKEWHETECKMETMRGLLSS